MSLVHLANVCSHLQNCTKANLSLAKIPLTRLHLNVSLNLYKQGFISAIQKGSDNAPDEPGSSVEITPDNIASRKLWLTLKYRNNEPVLRQMSLISKPNSRIHLTATEVKALAGGLYVREIKPIQPAETFLIQTEDKRVFELQEAAAQDLAGMALCRFR